MSSPDKFSRRCSLGFSLFELVVVLTVIAFLFAISAKHYQKHVVDSVEKLLLFQAGTFSRAVKTLRAVSIVKKASVIDMGKGIFIYVNQQGWPLYSNSLANIQEVKVGDESCKSLWYGFFESVEENNVTKSTVGQKKWLISAPSRYICRYQIQRKQEGSYFFDYDVRTGKVQITAP